LLAHFDGLVLEAYNGWSSYASTDLFKINIFLIIAEVQAFGHKKAPQFFLRGLYKILFLA